MLEPKEERRLLNRIRQGDRQAAERLVDLTYGQVFAAALRLTAGNTDAAADLTQETYGKAWKSLAKFDQRSKITTWLYRIAYNTYLNAQRRPTLMQPIEEEQVARVSDPKPNQDERLDRREVAARLRQAVIGLPEQLRFTVTARFWAELPVEEIATMEKVSGAAIRKRLKTAMARMRLALGEDAA